ncbi:MAG: glycosyltransferase family 2 protein [Candidatus Roizmanbacteria bacterium]|nr:MAG: glycosyltransferase family 2 protein [Candidatus Roizmanbacteria bacterium]
MNKLISVVIATFNSERTLDKTLNSIRVQNYPQEKIELILADGGSTDNTQKIGKNYGAKIINVPTSSQSAEYNKGYGLQYAKGQYILCIDHDNILPHKEWLNKMLKPHLENQNIVATETLRYHYDKDLTALDRYFALFGVNDPVPYYLGKADRQDYIQDKYALIGKSCDCGDYYLVEFDRNKPRKIPTLGANGFLIKKTYFEKSNHEPEQYFHIDINVDLVKLGYTKYAFIKDDIIHLTNSKFFNFIKRRKQFVDQYYLENFSARRYSVFYPEDSLKLVLYIIYTITLIKPIFDSIRGWMKIKDYAWFIHPFMCWVMLYIYGLATIKGFIRKLK